MADIQIFNNPEFGIVRTLEEDNGVVLFCASDVAKALGYARPKDAVAAHCKGAVKRRTPTNGGEQEMSFIPESDLYRLVFSSKLPTAEKFTDWVTSEVLPDIRKNGSYMMKIKSGVWYWLAMGSFATGLLYSMGLEGTCQTGGTVSDGAFITAIVLILLAIFFMRLGFAAEAREKRCCKIHKPQANTVKSGRKVG